MGNQVAQIEENQKRIDAQAEEKMGRPESTKKIGNVENENGETWSLRLRKKIKNVDDFQRKNDFFKKIKIWVIKAVIVSMQIKYNDPGSNLSLQTFVHKILSFYFWDSLESYCFSHFPDSFWWISLDFSTN